MKPIVIQVPSTKDGKVTLTVKELQDMLDKAYEAGKKDGTTNLNCCYPSTCPYKPWWYGNSYTYTNATGTTPDLSTITLTSTSASSNATISSTDTTVSGNNIFCTGSTNCCS